jgi:hypothetical protein
LFREVAFPQDLLGDDVDLGDLQRLVPSPIREGKPLPALGVFAVLLETSLKRNSPPNIKATMPIPHANDKFVPTAPGMSKTVKQQCWYILEQVH